MKHEKTLELFLQNTNVDSVGLAVSTAYTLKSLSRIPPRLEIPPMFSAYLPFVRNDRWIMS
jgi:hypothetical protein